MEGNIYVFGVIIEDILFFYGIYNLCDISCEGIIGEGSSFFDESFDDVFYGGKIDWVINEDYKLELFVFLDLNIVIIENYKFDLDLGEMVY